MRWDPPEFVAAKLVAELAGWDVTPGAHSNGFDNYYIATHIPTGQMYKAEVTVAGAKKLVELVMLKNRVAA